MELKVQNVSKFYNSSHKIVEAGKDINFVAREGEVIGLVGANGAGKTTLIKMICNLIYPTSGEILIDGKNIRSNKKLVEQNIGVVLEGARNVYNFLSVEQNIEYFSYLNGLSKKEMKKLKEELLSLFSMEGKRSTTVSDLSRGMQQKVAIMIALIKNPAILILDEPTLGLDIVGQLKMKDIIKKLAQIDNRLVLVSSHDIDLIRAVCTRALCFDTGRIVNDINLKLYGLTDTESNEIVVYIIDDMKIREKIISNDLGIIDDSDETENIIKIITTKSILEIMKHIDSSKVIKLEKRNSSFEEYLSEVEGIKR